MSPYMKRFVFASLFYLGLAAVFGIFNGIFEVTYFGVFAHTHFSLLGFMAMIVFGIGYFILPRFNGTELRFPGWVPFHFWLANVSLVGMVVFRGLSVETGEDGYRALFIIFAAGQALSLLMFVLNIWLTLTPSRQPQVVAKSSSAAPPAPASAPSSPARETAPPAQSRVPPVTADTKVADLIDTAPTIKDLLVSTGLRSLAMPEHIEQVRAMGVTVGMAAARHGIDPGDLIARIEQELENPPKSVSASVDSRGTVSHAGTDSISADVLIGTVMEKHPETKSVFQKYFGSGCFDCPGQLYESVDMACRMHGVDQKMFLNELNSTIRS